MRLTFSDTTISGVSVTNLNGDLLAPAPVTNTTSGFKAAKRSLQFEIFGDTAAGRSRFLISPNQDLALNLTAQTVSLSGQFTSVGAGPGNTIVPITINANISGSTANANAACSAFSPIQNLLGFETANDWTSPQARLSLSPALHTQGCNGLNVAGSGYMPVTSVPFSTPLAGVTGTLALDVFVPTGQPNPSWFGAVQMYASCPSGGLYNAYLGQVELTGKPTSAFSTAAFSLSSSVTSVLQQAHADCSFTVAVNVNATPSPVVLDNLRFLP